MSVRRGHRVLGAVSALVGTLAARGALEAQAPGGGARWTRANHRGEPVSLLEGPATAVGLLVGGVVGASSVRGAAAVACATAGAATFGLIDDLEEDTEHRTKGLRGHLGALAHGRLTTGGLKVLGIGATGLLAAAVATPRPRDGRRAAWVLDVAVSGALIAGTANLVNLLDLRPGRALKGAALAAAPVAVLGGAGAGIAASVVGAAFGSAEADLDGRDMLGDGGANALGAALGTTAVLDASRGVRLALLAGVVGLTVASERISFTEVIARTPVLREIDAWGRRPATGEGPGAAGAPTGRGAGLSG